MNIRQAWGCYSPERTSTRNRAAFTGPGWLACFLELPTKAPDPRESNGTRRGLRSIVPNPLRALEIPAVRLHDRRPEYWNLWLSVQWYMFEKPKVPVLRPAVVESNSR